jgi:hypothetical protein
MISISWAENILTLADERLAGHPIKICYLEAFCRDGSTNRSWEETVIPHTTKLINSSSPGTHLELQSVLADGVVVHHCIHAQHDEVSFDVELHNPTGVASRAHWAQPCIRVAEFTGVPMKRDSEEYLNKCFVFIDGKPMRMPTPLWNRQARYSPGQVWRPDHVNPADVNPRPMNPKPPSNGLIGCYSADDKLILATAWEPYQELFQGVLCCLHSDFRIGGLMPGERKHARGRIYLVPADMDALVRRYQQMGDTGLEHLSKVPENMGVAEERGTESGTLGGDSGFADAVAALMRLPLSDGEKADAVRRLLAGKWTA